MPFYTRLFRRSYGLLYGHSYMSGARWRETVPNSTKRRRRDAPAPESFNGFDREHAFQKPPAAALQGTVNPSCRSSGFQPPTPVLVQNIILVQCSTLHIHTYIHNTSLFFIRPNVTFHPCPSLRLSTFLKHPSPRSSKHSLSCRPCNSSLSCFHLYATSDQSSNASGLRILFG